MFHRAVTTSSLIALLAMGPAFAQDTTTETTESVEATVATDSGLNMGVTEGQEGPQIGQFYIRETYEDWALRCVKTDQEKDPCQLYQLLKDGEGNPLAEMNMFPLPEGGEAKAGAEIIVPLYTLLTANLRISVDGGPDRIFPYSYCSEQGCVARIGFSQADIDNFKSGNSATLSMVPVTAPDASVDLNISLKGFTAAYNGSPTE